MAGYLLVAGACARPAPVLVPAPLEGPDALSSSSAAAATPAPTPPSSQPAAPLPSTRTAVLTPADALAGRLMLPVAGADASKLYDSFDDGRDGERKHNAIDILAPRGTPILAADDGKVLRMSTNTLGGITLCASDANARFVYYYAHMDHYSKAMSEGRRLTKGDTIGFVGTTGNAPKDTPHLHFQIMLMPSDGGRYCNGEPIDPYPLLHAGRLFEPQ